MADKKTDMKRMIIAAVGAIAVIIALVVIFWVIEAPKTGKVDVVVAPIDATVKIGDKSFNNGNHRIEPGTYNVNITKEGFGSYSGQITIEDGKTEKLYVCLEKNENNTDYYSSHQKDADACWQVEEYNFERLEGEKYQDPIFKIAPFHSYSRGFYVDPYLEDDRAHIKITLVTCVADRAEGLKQNAIEWLTGKGIDINKYPVEYTSCAYGD